MNNGRIPHSNAQALRYYFPFLSINLFVDGSFRVGKQTKAYATVTDERGIDVVALYRPLFLDLELCEVECRRGTRTVACLASPNVQQQNNFAELVAMVMALRIAHRYPQRIASISSDSQLVLDYWSKGRVAPKTRASMDPVKLKFVGEASRLRTAAAKRIGQRPLLFHKVSGAANPADLGYHR